MRESIPEVCRFDTLMSSYPTPDSVHEEARWSVHVPPTFPGSLRHSSSPLVWHQLCMDSTSMQTSFPSTPSSLPPTSSSSSLIDQSHLSTRTIIGFALLGVGGLGICLALASVLYIKRRTKCAPPVLAHDLVGQYHLRGIGIYAGRVRRLI